MSFIEKKLIIKHLGTAASCAAVVLFSGGIFAQEVVSSENSIIYSLSIIGQDEPIEGTVTSTLYDESKQQIGETMNEHFDLDVGQNFTKGQKGTENVRSRVVEVQLKDFPYQNFVFNFNYSHPKHQTLGRVQYSQQENQDGKYPTFCYHKKAVKNASSSKDTSITFHAESEGSAGPPPDGTCPAS